MEFIKKEMYMSELKGKSVSQITLDDDFNVPDTKQDIREITVEKGLVNLDESKVMEGKVHIKGRLLFQILYTSAEEAGLETMGGEIPFDELVNMDGLEEKDHLQVGWDVDDLTVDQIHSRKISVKAILTFTLTAERLYQANIPVEVSDDDQVETLKKPVEAASLAVINRDTFRVKEEVELPGSKPNISRILWDDEELRSVEARPGDGKIHIRGEMVLFCVYRGEEENAPIQWLEKNIGFSGEIELSGAADHMIPDIGIRLMQKTVEPAADFDGEQRVISLEAILDLEIKLYEEENFSLLTDVYSPSRQLNPEWNPVNFESLLIRNNSRYKLNDKLEIKERDRVLQICHANGSAKIDDVRITEDGLLIEGALCVWILYIPGEDDTPFKSIKGVLPFQYTAEAKGITPDCVYRIQPGIESLNAVMMGNNEVELKAVLTFEVLVLQKISEKAVASVSEEALDYQKLEAMPGIAGYIVQPQDTLWDVAKRFHTTMKVIQQTNGISGEEVESGTRLLILKQVEEFI